MSYILEFLVEFLIMFVSVIFGIGVLILSAGMLIGTIVGLISGNWALSVTCLLVLSGIIALAVTIAWRVF